MSKSMIDKIDYTVFCVNEFARSNSLSYRDAFDYLDKRWDVVHGFIADDRIVRLLDALVKGTTTEESVLRTLQASRFKSVQYSFHSAMAVSLLKRIEVKHV